MNIYKKVLVSLFIMKIVLLVGCSSAPQQQANDSRPGLLNDNASAIVEFEKTTHEFGKIVSGEKVSYSFRFTNTGDAPLVISNTRSGCGCTAGQYSRQPIAPGESGQVTVIFNSAGRMGFQSESIRVFTNAEPSEYVLRITAEVS
jgi:hypothetical protein